MASFDLILCVGKAYQKTWRERGYLFRMAIIPLFIKYIFYTLSLLYVGPDNILRLSLFMLPAYFVEGWLLSHWARTIMMGHRWPFRPTGNDAVDNDALSERGRGVLGGTVTFTLINFLMAGYFAFFMSYIPLDIDPQQADPKVAGIGAIMMVSTFLLFRFIWTYIPMAINYPIQDFIKKLKPISLTFNMIGLWLVCFIPAVMLLQLSAGLLKGVSAEGGAAAPIIDGAVIFLRVALDMIKNLVCTAGMAYAFMEIFSKPKNNGAKP